MSTRSQTVIEYNGGHKICQFYRHCDGCPEGHGCDLCNAVDKAGENVIEMLDLLRIFEIEMESVDTRIHGDVEFLYKVTLQNPCECHPEDIPPQVVTIYTVRHGTPQEIIYQGAPRKVRMDIIMGKAVGA